MSRSQVIVAPDHGTWQVLGKGPVQQARELSDALKAADERARAASLVGERVEVVILTPLGRELTERRHLGSAALSQAIAQA